MGLWGERAKRLSRRHTYAVLLGALLAGTPLLAFDYWIGRVIERQTLEDVSTSAKRAIGLAETRIRQTIGGLDQLAQGGVNSCQGPNLEAMRRLVFAIPPLKEIAIVDPRGQTMCSQFGAIDGRRDVVAAEPLGDNYLIEVVEVAERDRRVRLRRKAGDGAGSLAALLPSELFVPQVSTQGGTFGARARMYTASGVLLGESGSLTEADSGLPLVTKWTSGKYGLTVEIAVPHSAVGTRSGELEWLGLLAKIAVAFVLIGFAVLLPRRQLNNPVAELERAIEAGELIPYYQPIVDIRSGQLRGAEVLVRWKKPDGSLVLPGAFIPLAESSGLVLPLTRMLMKRVCVEAGAAIGSRPGLKITFNFAAQLFRDESVVKDVRNIFAGSPIDLTQVVLELTERDPIENLTETRRVIAALQGIGVRIAIDDVGTGHSGLSYMLKLGVDIIKIDKMFVDAIGTDRNSTTIVETLIDLAHNMRMDVVAEGVENFEQVMHLRELGIRSAQGYVFAPPLPGSAFLQLVEAIDPLPAASVEGKVAAASRRYMSARTKFGTA
jgi:sensor c-di-GMP phosphodiesterase-like protein